MSVILVTFMGWHYKEKSAACHSYERPRQNFSLWYQYNIKQTSDENKEKYQSGDYKLIQWQILQTNITRTVWQTVRRIAKWDLGSLRVKGLKIKNHQDKNYSSHFRLSCVIFENTLIFNLNVQEQFWNIVFEFFSTQLLIWINCMS